MGDVGGGVADGTANGLLTSDTGPYFIFLITFGSAFAFIGANIAFRQIATAGLLRNVLVLLMMILVWILWTVVSLLISRGSSQSQSALFGAWIQRVSLSISALMSGLMYLYVDDYLKHTSIVDGMSLAESILYILGGFMLLAAIQTFFHPFASVELTLLAERLRLLKGHVVAADEDDAQGKRK
jgi:hypothetical protein